MVSAYTTPPVRTRALSSGGRQLCVQRFRVAVVTGPDAGRTAHSDGAELSIGSAPENKLVIGDPTVSRHHLAIAATAGGFLVRDLGSTNGTRIAGVRIETAYIEPGSQLLAGETECRFDLSGGEIRVPLADVEQFGPVLGKSPAMRRLFALLPRIAESDATFLIEGETGTGKGLIAESVHAMSPRKDGPLVVIDCGAIPPTLIESELFGHEKGAFTGADSRRQGAFEAANGGTVFLDEIGELPLDVQPVLLRVLEKRAVRRVGGTGQVAVDVRVIAATNRDLRREVNQGTFRADLFYRLCVLHAKVPPLRERSEDVPMLAAHFYSQLKGGGQRPPAELLSRLLRQPWPGNVRELRSAVERAVFLGAAAALERPLGAGPAGPGAAGPGARVVPGQTFREAKAEAVAAWERTYLATLVHDHQGNLSQAARAVKMDRNHLRDLLHRHGIDP
ncbi:MAG TPA: sigma 54-interacting transcriptional regulator [Kofleriaceae bacterium]|nr:sigma 54-interacting transcriptional regulator [Kofleriaceae bacterium]